jgi:hypothetical protein
MWNWQRKDWRLFKYDKSVISELEQKFLLGSGECFGILKHISYNQETMLKIALISDEALKTSEIKA